MIIDDITQDDVITILEHVQATCACRISCDGCNYNTRGEGCALAHLPERWQLDQIGGDHDDSGE